MIDLCNIEKYRENNRIEAKKALGGLPESIWETYSAFANTLGGVILLGVEEFKDKSLHPVDLPSPHALTEEFLSGLNDKRKVSVNILTEKNIQIQKTDNKHFIAITVPAAQRSDKPVYIEGNPFSGTYQRNGEGDFRVSKEIVEEMLKNAQIKSPDEEILHMTVDALDKKSIKKYLSLCSPFSRDADIYDKNSNISYASLLMFGKFDKIKKVFPQFALKYTDANENIFRTNLFDFYTSVCESLKSISSDIEVYQCLQEATLNAIINADYFSGGGIEIKCCASYISFTNAGSFGINIKDAEKGGVSAHKNPQLTKFFSAINALSSTGSGIPFMYSVWQKNNWSAPVFKEDVSPQRITLILYFYKTECLNTSTPPHIAIETVLEYLTEKVYAKSDDIAELLNIPLTSAQKLLEKLEQQNIIVFNKEDGNYKMKDK